MLEVHPTTSTTLIKIWCKGCKMLWRIKFKLWVTNSIRWLMNAARNPKCSSTCSSMNWKIRVSDLYGSIDKLSKLLLNSCSKLKAELLRSRLDYNGSWFHRVFQKWFCKLYGILHTINQVESKWTKTSFLIRKQKWRWKLDDKYSWGIQIKGLRECVARPRDEQPTQGHVHYLVP